MLKSLIINNYECNPLCFIVSRLSETLSNGDEPCRSLWVGNINPEEVSERHLLQLFSRCGRVDNVRILPKRFCAFVNFEKAESAAITLEKLQVGFWVDHVLPTGKLFLKVKNGSLFFVTILFLCK